MADELSSNEYLLKRARNIAENKAKLILLGLEEPPASKPKTVRAARAPREPQEPTRSSGRLSGVAPEVKPLDDVDLEASDSGSPPSKNVDHLTRASSASRLSEEQMAKLDALEPVSSAPLTEAELENLELAEQDMRAGRTPGGWRASAAKGVNDWVVKRELLNRVRQELGLRWPQWLATIEREVPMGSTVAAKAQTMYRLERAACGLGLDYKNWPKGVGVLLSNKRLPKPEKDGGGNTIGPPARPPRQLLTLGADTEIFKRQGQRLEARFGRDAGNGWVYNHALGKLRILQM